MRIHTLKIRNFYGIIEQDYAFSSGIVNISGPNGSGKTSVVKALQLLFLNETEESLAECIHWEAESFEVESTFELRGKQFHYEISSDGKKTNRKLDIDSQVYVGSDAVEAMQEYFHPSLTRSSVFAMQGEDDLVNTKPAARREHLRQVYDLDFSDQKKKLEESRDEEKTELQKVENSISILANKEYEEREIIALPFDHAVRTEKQNRVESIDVELASFNEALRNWETKNTTLQQLVSQKEKKEQQLSDSQKKLDVANQELQQVPLQTQEKRTQKQTELEKLNNDIESIRLVRLKPFDSASLDEAQKEHNTYSAQAQMIAQQLTKIEDKDDCPVCGAPISSEHIQELQDECDALKAKADEAKKVVGSLTQEFKEYTERKNQNEEMSRKKTDLTNRIERVTSELDDLDEHQTLLEEVAQKKIAMSIEKINELETDIADIGSQISSLENEVLGKKPEPNSNLQSEREALKKEISEYDRVKIWNDEAKKYNIELEQKKKEDQEKIDSLVKAKQSLEYSIQEYAEAIQIVNTLLPSFIISQVVKGLENNVNEFLRMTYPKYNIQIQETKKALKIVYGPAEKDVRHASGFERQVFSFGYKHALSQIQGTKLLVLDEVDAFADDENSEKFYETLGTMSSMYEQMFVITHRSVAKDLLEREFGAMEIEL